MPERHRWNSKNTHDFVNSLIHLLLVIEVKKKKRDAKMRRQGEAIHIGGETNRVLSSQRSPLGLLNNKCAMCNVQCQGGFS